MNNIENIDNKVSKRTLLFSLVAFSIAFLLGYGFLGYLPHWNSINMRTSIDELIPFIPEFFVFYFLGMLYAFLAFFVVKDKFRFDRMIKGFFIIMGISYLFFLLFPVVLPKEITYTDNIFDFLVKHWHINDTNFNNFPSLHVAFSVYAWLIIDLENRKLSYWTASIVLGIVASVLFIKSHLIIDVIGGIALAIGVFIWYKSKLVFDKINEK